MKKNIGFLILLFTISYSSFGQKLNPADLIAYEDYLLKSKKQKETSLAIAIPGVALFTIGTIMYMSQFRAGLSGGTNYSENKSKIGESLTYIAGAAILGSTIFRIASKINKRKAMTMLIIENQKATLLLQKGVLSSFNHSTTLRIRLNHQNRFIKNLHEHLLVYM